MRTGFVAGLRPADFIRSLFAFGKSEGTLIIALLAAFQPAVSGATTVGATPGSFGVSETGAATYSIPIAVPPGTAGMEPKLSLNYSSQSGNGIAGVGWSLGGLSAITRCAQTIIHDGQTRGVQLDADDRFCLDGQRLIVINGTAYGAVGAEYRTEIESFSRVVSFGGTVGDPQYFKVWTKAGQIIEFGNTSDARVEAQGKTLAAAWAANKISDTLGNYIAFAYFEDNANGEHRIESIGYTGNATAGVTPYSSMEFQYETRPDPSSGYLAGSLSRQSQRLTHIITRANGTMVADYGLSYEIGTATGRSRLASLTQCTGDGDCLSPTTFMWQEGEAASFETMAMETSTPTGDAITSWFAIGDVNADGRSDVVTFKNTLDMRLYTADGQGSLTQSQQYSSPFISPYDPNVFVAPNMRFWLADLNGDGYAEPVMCGIHGVLISGYSPWNLIPWETIPLPDGQARIQLTASNSLLLYYQNPYVAIRKQWCMPTQSPEGKTDVVLYLSEDLKGFGLISDFTVLSGYRAATASLEGNSAYPPLRNADTAVALTADLNGDGHGDMLRYDPSTGALFTWMQKNDAFLPVISNSIDSGGTPYNRWFTVGDVNGDGLSDMVLHTPANGKLKVWLSKGNGSVTAKFETAGFSTGGTPSDTWFLMADVNADGRADAVKYTPSSGNILFALSNGDGTFGAPITATIATGFNPTPTVGPNPTTAWFQPADINGDGLLDWVVYHPSEGKVKVNLGRGAIPDLLLAITNGHGATRSITYKTLTDPGVYIKGSGAVYPEQDVQAAMYVVSETSSDDGIGGSFLSAYRYEGARTHLTGRGFLGFKVLEQSDLQTGIVTRSEYSQTFPNIGTPLLVTKTTSDGIELSRVENAPASKSLNADKTVFPYVAYSKEQGKDLNGAVLPSTETWNTYGDDWGNLTKVITQTSDGFKKTTDNTYINDAAKWHLGRLTRASVASSINNGGWTQTRVSAFEYNPTTGLLTKETIEPDQPQYRLDTTYTFDTLGNRKAVTVSSPATGTAAIASRTTTTTYDAKGQFPVTITNALGHVETKIFDTSFGKVTSLTGPNNLTTTWQYDGFGRKTRENRADGTYTIWTYAACDAACPNWGTYRIVTQVFAPGGIQAAPASVIYFDKLDREVRTATQGFDGRWIYKDTVYDNRGNVDMVSRPYYMGDTAYWIDQSHDELNRLIQVIEPDNLAKPALIVDYNGLSITRTNRKDQVTIETRNSQGQKVSVTDAMMQTTQYHYDPFGNLQYALNPGGTLESLAMYDIRGRKVWNYTPDMGGWNYEYDALGELIKQTDAKSQITSFVYDVLGRMTRRVEPGMTSDWVYDTAGYGKGKLATATTNTGYLRAHYYDNKGRPQLTLTNLSGSGGGLLFSSVAYDAAGRQSEQYYSSGLGIKNIYNGLGYLAEVRKVGDNTLYWQLNTMDAEGHVIQETLGNNTVSFTAHDPRNGRFNYRIDNRNGTWIAYHSQIYDSIGNVSERYQLGGPFSFDMLAYDALNRLTQTDSNVGGVASTQAVAYAAGGNITSKTGVGDYYYGGNANCPAGSNAGSHAVCKAGSYTYAYDFNGNQTGGGGRSLTWTSWNMPASLAQGGQTTTWLYGPEHDRFKMVAAGRTTLYLNPGIHQGAHYEQTWYASGTTEHRHTLYGGGRPVGEVLTFTVAGGTAPAAQTRYFHSDAQGSITAVTDQNGAVLTRYRYDPWGKQTVVSGSNTGIDQTRQGHTGHEMLDGGLTHMNGRLYDPTLSRFVSADPIVQEPYNLQSLNRYSYVWNNPLGYTDPTGYFGWEISPSLGRGLFALGGIMFGAVLGPAGPIFAGGGWATTLASGALAGGVGGFIGSGGNAQAARQGALAGGLFAGAGLLGESLKGSFGTFANDGLGRAALHAAAGCISASAGGGSCGTGAMTAGFTKFASANLGDYGDIGNLVKYSVIGGTASVIGGGKFANGAMTGAWQYLVNEKVSQKSGSVRKPLAVCSSDWVRCQNGLISGLKWNTDDALNVTTGAVAGVAGVALCSTGAGCIVGAPLLFLGANDFKEAWSGSSFLEDWFGPPGKQADAVLDLAGGPKGAIHGTAKLFIPGSRMDGVGDLGMGTIDAVKGVRGANEQRQ